MEIKKCPNCENEQLIMVVEELIEKEYSVLTGKLLKVVGKSGVNCWNYKCRCGWYSKLFTE